MITLDKVEEKAENKIFYNNKHIEFVKFIDYHYTGENTEYNPKMEENGIKIFISRVEEIAKTKRGLFTQQDIEKILLDNKVSDKEHLGKYIDKVLTSSLIVSRGLSSIGDFLTSNGSHIQYWFTSHVGIDNNTGTNKLYRLESAFTFI
ncbi:MAG: hypothetical protein ABIH65_01015 [Nanoarchaeota archaeon]